MIVIEIKTEQSGWAVRGQYQTMTEAYKEIRRLLDIHTEIAVFENGKLLFHNKED